MSWVREAKTPAKPVGGRSALARRPADERAGGLREPGPPAAGSARWDFARIASVAPEPLAIGAADDPLEREADRVADRVMRAVASPAEPVTAAAEPPVDVARNAAPALRRACTRCADCTGNCADDERKTLRRKPAGAAETDLALGAPPSVHALLRSPGAPLDPHARSVLEPRFGHDFGAVRVHTDAAAAAAANAVHARAFTVGQHVAFGAGEYRPASADGRRLIAHELAHTLQQRTPGTRVVARQVAPAPTPTALPATVPVPAATDFQINRVGGSTTARISFARGSAALGADAASAIDDLKTAAPAGVRLIGYASADEPAALAQTRADAVKAALLAPPDPVAVSAAVGNAPATASRSDYVGARSVEVLVGAAAPSTVDCAAHDAAGNLLNPPTRPCPAMDPATWTAFNAALPVAQNAMARAVAAVAGAPTAANAAVIDRFFGNHAAATVTALSTNLANLKTHVDNLAAITSCGGECDTGGCGGGSVIAYNKDVDAASTMTLCVPVFKSMNLNDRVRNLIHESAHGTSPLGGAPGTGTADVAYRHERMLFQLSTADRLRNSDSYALFALFLREIQTTGNAAAVPSGIATPSADTLLGFAANPAGVAEQQAMRLALAMLEKRLNWSQNWSGQLYGQAQDVRTGASTWAASWAESLMTAAAARFPLTAPPAAPTLADQTRLAAILDRYLRMSAAAKRGLVVTRAVAGVAAWTAPAAASPIAGAAVQVGEDFFHATPANQVSLLLEQLARRTPEVEAAFVPAYVSLAKWIHDQNP